MEKCRAIGVIGLKRCTWMPAAARRSKNAPGVDIEPTLSYITSMCTPACCLRDQQVAELLAIVLESPRACSTRDTDSAGPHGWRQRWRQTRCRHRAGWSRDCRCTAARRPRPVDGHMALERAGVRGLRAQPLEQGIGLALRQRAAGAGDFDVAGNLAGGGLGNRGYVRARARAQTILAPAPGSQASRASWQSVDP